MATDFTLSYAASALFPDADSALFTLLLDSAAGSNVSYALSDGGAGGVFTSSPVVVTTGNLPGFFTYRPSASAVGPIVITAVASGGLVKTHTITVPINFPYVGTNAIDVMEEALSLLGVMADGEPIPGERIARGLVRVNGIIDGMRVDPLWSSGVETIKGTLKAGAKSVSIGPSGDIGFVTRLSPVRILDGSFFSIGTLDYPMNEMSQGAFNDIRFKTFNTIGPDGWFFNTGSPNATLSFYPQASGDVPLTLQVETQLREFADPTTRYGLPPGYKRMLSYTLARDWGPTFRRELSPSQAQAGMNARREVQRSNHRTPAFRQPSRAGNILIGWET